MFQIAELNYLTFELISKGVKEKRKKEEEEKIINILKSPYRKMIYACPISIS